MRYPYPKAMGSGYQKEYFDKLKDTIVLPNGEAFNLEKESKIEFCHLRNSNLLLSFRPQPLQ